MFVGKKEIPLFFHPFKGFLEVYKIIVRFLYMTKTIFKTLIDKASKMFGDKRISPCCCNRARDQELRLGNLRKRP